MTSLTTPFKLSKVSYTARVFSILTLFILYGDLAAAEHRVALVIGNAAYEKSLLSNSINDAQDMAEVLKQVGFEVTILKNATQNDMETAIQTFGKRLESGDVGLFYFAGHGVQYQGDNYLFPTDTIRTVSTPGHLRLKTVNVDYVLSVMEGAGNDLNIVILDTCRHNPFKELVRGINNDGRTLKAPSGSVIAYSTRPDAEATEGAGRNSPYVKYLKKELRKPGLPIEQVLREVRIAVMQETNGQQAPGYYSELNRQFCFVGPCEANSTPSISQHPVTRSPFIPTPMSPNDTLPNGKIFQDNLLDGSLGPEMVWIPAGPFRMGDTRGEGDKRELPVHLVSVVRFALGHHEVTFDEYDLFAEATGKDKPKDASWGRGHQPVINVSWLDATAYAEWLSQQTGQTYRLPTEAEWEYAARAGTDTRYWWGNEIGTQRANCNGCGSQWDNRQTAPVCSFAESPFRLCDMIGNVWEWTCSKYEDKYSGKEQQCASQDSVGLQVIRGGAWNDNELGVRATYRLDYSFNNHNNLVGFRVARE